VAGGGNIEKYEGGSPFCWARKLVFMSGPNDGRLNVGAVAESPNKGGAEGAGPNMGGASGGAVGGGGWCTGEDDED